MSEMNQRHHRQFYEMGGQDVQIQMKTPLGNLLIPQRDQQNEVQVKSLLSKNKRPSHPQGQTPNWGDRSPDNNHRILEFPALNKQHMSLRYDRPHGQNRPRSVMNRNTRNLNTIQYLQKLKKKENMFQNNNFLENERLVTHQDRDNDGDMSELQEGSACHLLTNFSNASNQDFKRKFNRPSTSINRNEQSTVFRNFSRKGSAMGAIRKTSRMIQITSGAGQTSSACGGSSMGYRSSKMKQLAASSGINCVTGMYRPATTMQYGGQPEETIQFMEDGKKGFEQTLEHSNERKKMRVVKKRQQYGLIDQINQYPSQVEQDGDKKSSAKGSKIFNHKNLGIAHKNRKVDATITAYKLLESAYINQPGNPNNLERKFQMNDEKLIEELKVGPSKRPLNPQRRAITPKNETLQNFDINHGFLNTLMSPKHFDNAVPTSSQYETKDESQKLSRMNLPLDQSENNHHYVAPTDDEQLKKESLQGQPKQQKSTASKQLGFNQPSQMPQDHLREGSRRKLVVKKKSVKTGKRAPKRRTSVRATRGGKYGQDVEVINNQIGQRIIKMLEEVTQKRESDRQKHADGNLLPMFSSNHTNHIQNLTINAQPGYNIEQLTHINNDSNQNQIPLVPQNDLNNLEYQIYRQQQQQDHALHGQQNNDEHESGIVDMFSQLPPISTSTPQKKNGSNNNPTNPSTLLQEKHLVVGHDKIKKDATGSNMESVDLSKSSSVTSLESGRALANHRTPKIFRKKTKRENFKRAKTGAGNMMSRIKARQNETLNFTPQDFFANTNSNNDADILSSNSQLQTQIKQGPQNYNMRILSLKKGKTFAMKKNNKGRLSQQLMLSNDKSEHEQNSGYGSRSNSYQQSKQNSRTPIMCKKETKRMLDGNSYLMPPKKTKTHQWPSMKKQFRDIQMVGDDNQLLRIRTKIKIGDIMKGPMKCSPPGMMSASSNSKSHSFSKSNSPVTSKNSRISNFSNKMRQVNSQQKGRGSTQKKNYGKKRAETLIDETDTKLYYFGQDPNNSAFNSKNSSKNKCGIESSIKISRSYSNQNSNVPRTNVIENVTEDSNEPLVQLLRQKINQIRDVEGLQKDPDQEEWKALMKRAIDDMSKQEFAAVVQQAPTINQSAQSSLSKGSRSRSTSKKRRVRMNPNSDILDEDEIFNEYQFQGDEIQDALGSIQMKKIEIKEDLTEDVLKTEEKKQQQDTLLVVHQQSKNSRRFSSQSVSVVESNRANDLIDAKLFVDIKKLDSSRNSSRQKSISFKSVKSQMPIREANLEMKRSQVSQSHREVISDTPQFIQEQQISSNTLTNINFDQKIKLMDQMMLTLTKTKDQPIKMVNSSASPLLKSSNMSSQQPPLGSVDQIQSRERNSDQLVENEVKIRYFEYKEQAPYQTAKFKNYQSVMDGSEKQKRRTMFEQQPESSSKEEFDQLIPNDTDQDRHILDSDREEKKDVYSQQKDELIVKSLNPNQTYSKTSRNLIENNIKQEEDILARQLSQINVQDLDRQSEQSAFETDSYQSNKEGKDEDPQKLKTRIQDSQETKLIQKVESPLQTYDDQKKKISSMYSQLDHKSSTLKVQDQSSQEPVFFIESSDFNNNQYQEEEVQSSSSHMVEEDVLAKPSLQQQLMKAITTQVQKKITVGFDSSSNIASVSLDSQKSPLTIPIDKQVSIDQEKPALVKSEVKSPPGTLLNKMIQGLQERIKIKEKEIREQQFKAELAKKIEEEQKINPQKSLRLIKQQTTIELIASNSPVKTKDIDLKYRRQKQLIVREYPIQRFLKYISSFSIQKLELEKPEELKFDKIMQVKQKIQHKKKIFYRANKMAFPQSAQMVSPKEQKTLMQQQDQNVFDFADALSQLCSNFPESLQEKACKTGCLDAGKTRFRITEEFASYYLDTEDVSHDVHTAQKNEEHSHAKWEADVGHTHIDPVLSEISHEIQSHTEDISEEFSLKKTVTTKQLKQMRHAEVSHFGADDYQISEEYNRAFGRQATKKIYDAGIGKAFGLAKEEHDHEGHRGANKTDYQKKLEKEMLIFKKSPIAQLMPLHYKPYQGCSFDRICAYTTLLERQYQNILQTKLFSDTFNFKGSLLDQYVSFLLLQVFEELQKQKEMSGSQIVELSKLTMLRNFTEEESQNQIIHVYDINMTDIIDPFMKQKIGIKQVSFIEDMLIDQQEQRVLFMERMISQDVNSVEPETIPSLPTEGDYTPSQSQPSPLKSPDAVSKFQDLLKMTKDKPLLCSPNRLSKGAIDFDPLRKLYQGTNKGNASKLPLTEKDIREFLEKKLKSSFKSYFLIVKTSAVEESEHEIKQKFREQNQEQLKYRKNRQIKIQLQQQRIKDEKKQQSHLHYMDLVWQEKNNKIALLIMENPYILDNHPHLYTMSLQDVKRLVQNKNIQDQFDWQSLDMQNIMFRKKVEANFNKYKNDFYQNLNYLISLNFDIESLISSEDHDIYKQESDGKFIYVHQQCLDQLREKYLYNTFRKISPVSIDFLISIVNQPALNYINEKVFKNRFKETVENCRWTHSAKQIDKRNKNILSRTDEQELPSRFSQYIAFHSVQQSQNFNQLLFMHKINSLYQNLYDIDQDYQLNYTIEKLYSQSRHRFYAGYYELMKKNKNSMTEQEHKKMDMYESVVPQHLLETTSPLKSRGPQTMKGLSPEGQKEQISLIKKKFMEGDQAQIMQKRQEYKLKRNGDEENVAASILSKQRMARVFEENKTDNEISDQGSPSKNQKGKLVQRQAVSVILKSGGQLGNLNDGKKKPKENTSVISEDEQNKQFGEMKKKQEILQLERANKIANDMESFLKKNVQYTRQNALDRYSGNNCEFHVLRNIDQKMCKMKDSVNIFYKTVEQMINLTDINNTLLKTFGYKSVLIRDSMHDHIMEIYIPITLERGQEKLKVQEIKTYKPTSFSEFKKYTKLKQNIKQKKNKMFQALTVDGFQTDDSMREIDYDDILTQSSDEKDEFDEDKDKQSDSEYEGIDKPLKDKLKKEKCSKSNDKIKKKNRMKRLAAINKQKTAAMMKEADNYSTALEHYKNLKKKKIQAEKAQYSTKEKGNKGGFLMDEHNKDASLFLAQVRGDKEKLFSIVNGEDMAENTSNMNNFFKKIKSNFQVDGLILLAQQRVIQDNVEQTKKLKDLQRLIKEKRHKMQQKIKNAREEVESIENRQETSSNEDMKSEVFKSVKSISNGGEGSAVGEDGEPMLSRRDRRRGNLPLNINHEEILKQDNHKTQNNTKFDKQRLKISELMEHQANLKLQDQQLEANEKFIYKTLKNIRKNAQMYGLTNERSHEGHNHPPNSPEKSVKFQSEEPSISPQRMNPTNSKNALMGLSANLLQQVERQKLQAKLDIGENLSSDIPSKQSEFRNKDSGEFTFKSEAVNDRIQNQQKSQFMPRDQKLTSARAISSGTFESSPTSKRLRKPPNTISKTMVLTTNQSLKMKKYFDHIENKTLVLKLDQDIVPLETKSTTTKNIDLTNRPKLDFNQGNLANVRSAVRNDHQNVAKDNTQSSAARKDGVKFKGQQLTLQSPKAQSDCQADNLTSMMKKKMQSSWMGPQHEPDKNLVSKGLTRQMLQEVAIMRVQGDSDSEFALENELNILADIKEKQKEFIKEKERKLKKRLLIVSYLQKDKSLQAPGRSNSVTKNKMSKSEVMARFSAQLQQKFSDLTIQHKRQSQGGEPDQNNRIENLLANLEHDICAKVQKNKNQKAEAQEKVKGVYGKVAKPEIIDAKRIQIFKDQTGSQRDLTRQSIGKPGDLSGPVLQRLQKAVHKNVVMARAANKFETKPKNIPQPQSRQESETKLLQGGSPTRGSVIDSNELIQNLFKPKDIILEESEDEMNQNPENKAVQNLLKALQDFQSLNGTGNQQQQAKVLQQATKTIDWPEQLKTVQFNDQLLSSLISPISQNKKERINFKNRRKTSRQSEELVPSKIPGQSPGPKGSMIVKKIEEGLESNALKVKFQPNSFKSQTDMLIKADKERQTQMFIARMHQAIQHRNTGLMEDILKRFQGNLDKIGDKCGNSLLTLAVMQGDFKMSEILLRKGANVNIQNDQGNTPLHYAIQKKFNKCIDTLIAYQCDESIENADGKTPWQMSTQIF